MKSNNPLIQAYRKPNVFIALPSGGKWYDPAPQLSVDSELAVYPMTARDELITKTPDALYNGEATVALIHSCCPDIENPRQIPMSDLTVILLGIRASSYGNEIELDLTCPECKGLNQTKADISRLLGTVKPLDVDPIVELPNGFKVEVSPFNLEDRTNLQLQQIKQQKMLQALVANDQLTDKEREEQFGKAFVEIAQITVQVITNSIRGVTPPESEVVTDNDTIIEWLNEISKSDYDAIRGRVEEMSESGIDSTFTAHCQHCDHEWKTTVDLDMANFFAG